MVLNFLMYYFTAEPRSTPNGTPQAGQTCRTHFWEPCTGRQRNCQFAVSELASCGPNLTTVTTLPPLPINVQRTRARFTLTTGFFVKPPLGRLRSRAILEVGFWQKARAIWMYVSRCPVEFKFCFLRGSSACVVVFWTLSRGLGAMQLFGRARRIASLWKRKCIRLFWFFVSVSYP